MSSRSLTYESSLVIDVSDTRDDVEHSILHSNVGARGLRALRHGYQSHRRRVSSCVAGNLLLAATIVSHAECLQPFGLVRSIPVQRCL